MAQISDPPAADLTDWGAFMLLIGTKLQWSKVRTGFLIANVLNYFFPLHSGWQTSGLGRPGRQSHHCAVGLEERREALCHEVSLKQLNHTFVPVAWCFEDLTNLTVNSAECDLLKYGHLWMRVKLEPLCSWKLIKMRSGKKGNYFLCYGLLKSNAKPCWMVTEFAKGYLLYIHN